MEFLEHQSGVNQSGEAFIQLVQNNKPICQMTPSQAREHATAILECTEAAEQDSFLVHFFQHKLGLEKDKAIMVLMEYRNFRSKFGKSGTPLSRDQFKTEKGWGNVEEGRGCDGKDKN